jgi:hypothetical protein
LDLVDKEEQARILAIIRTQREGKIVEDPTVSLLDYFKLAYDVRHVDYTSSKDDTVAWCSAFTAIDIDSVAVLLRNRLQLNGEVGARITGLPADGNSAVRPGTAVIPTWFLYLLFSPRMERAYTKRRQELGSLGVVAGPEEGNDVDQAASDPPALPDLGDLPSPAPLPFSSYLQQPLGEPLISPVTPSMGGLCGVWNPGGTKCFGISTIQALGAVPSFASLLRSAPANNGHLCSFKEHCILHQAGVVLNDVSQRMAGTRATTFDPVEDLLVGLGLHNFQQDANEFLTLFLDAGVTCELDYYGNDGVTYVRHDSSGWHQSTFCPARTTRLAQHFNVHTCFTTIDAGGHSSSNTTACYCVSMELKWAGGRADSVDAALAHFVKPEAGMMKRCNAGVCGINPLTNVPHSCGTRFVAPLPPVLYLHLKRFSQDDYGHPRKIESRVSFRLTEQLPGHPDVFFKLCSIVCQLGHQLTSGHYVTFFRKLDTSDDVEKWYHASDSIVSEVDVNRVLSTPDAYLLFYEQQPAGYVSEDEPVSHVVPAVSDVSPVGVNADVDAVTASSATHYGDTTGLTINEEISSRTQYAVASDNLGNLGVTNALMLTCPVDTSGKCTEPTGDIKNLTSRSLMAKAGHLATIEHDLRVVVGSILTAHWRYFARHGKGVYTAVKKHEHLKEMSKKSVWSSLGLFLHDPGNRSGMTGFLREVTEKYMPTQNFKLAACAGCDDLLGKAFPDLIPHRADVQAELTAEHGASASEITEHQKHRESAQERNDHRDVLLRNAQILGTLGQKGDRGHEAMIRSAVDGCSQNHNPLSRLRGLPVQKNTDWHGRGATRSAVFRKLCTVRSDKSPGSLAHLLLQSGGSIADLKDLSGKKPDFRKAEQHLKSSTESILIAAAMELFVLKMPQALAVELVARKRKQLEKEIKIKAKEVLVSMDVVGKIATQRTESLQDEAGVLKADLAALPRAKKPSGRPMEPANPEYKWRDWFDAEDEYDRVLYMAFVTRSLYDKNVGPAFQLFLSERTGLRSPCGFMYDYKNKDKLCFKNKSNDGYKSLDAWHKHRRLHFDAGQEPTPSAVTTPIGPAGLDGAFHGRLQSGATPDGVFEYSRAVLFHGGI